MPIVDWYKEIPGYKEAVERENDVRDNAFLGLNESVAGVEVKPLTPNMFLLLDGISSPFVCGGTPLPEDVAVALWIVSPRYRASDRKARNLFIRLSGKLDYITTRQAFYSYVSDSFIDSPGVSKSTRSATASWVASLVDILASEYSWTEERILSISLKRIFQYLKLIQLRHDPKATMFNKSDELRSKWLAEQNLKAKKAGSK